MKANKVRTLIAAGTIGVIGLTGIASASAAGALGAGGAAKNAVSRLTVEQKSCLSEQGITKPEGRPTAEQRSAIRTAAENCGITVPNRKGPLARRAAQLTQDQRDCLQSNGVTKPDHKLSAEERASFITQLKAAAETCGIQRNPSPVN